MPTPLQKFLIAPLKSGQQSNVKPWLIADDAYAQLRNAYTWRGRVKKRFGARVMDQSKAPAIQQQFTRLRMNVGTTDGFGNLVGIPFVTSFSIGQMFSIGDVYFTIQALGAVVVILSTSPPDAMSVNTGTGNFVVQFADPLTAVYFYPAKPVMGFYLYDQIEINAEITIAFDTQFSYEYVNGFGWNRSGVTTQGLWSGTDSQFHWATNYRGTQSSDYVLFVVNNNNPDGIQYLATVAGQREWFTLVPPVLNAAGDTLLTSLMVLPFKDRLLFLNVTENVVGPGVTTFTSRIVFSQNGSPFTADAFRQDIVGKGGYIEAPTKESIVSAEFLKDRLIIFFENSTWELVYTNNQVLPFVFQKINTELGVESTHSIIPFDKVAVGMGSTGIHACTGINVDRIDAIIPDTVFDISNINNGPKRVYGVRDYYEELCYWTYSSSAQSYGNNAVFPNRVLVYDYINNTWAFNDDSITAFGYFYLQDNTLVWANITNTWQQMTQQWDDFESERLFRSVIAGNQEGWTFIVRPELQRNCMSLQITNIVPAANDVTLTIINHNLEPNSYVFLSNISDDGTLNTLNNTIQQVIYVDANTVTIFTPVTLVGNYQGAGTVELISRVQITTKQYNFFPDSGRYTFIAYADMYVNRTAAGLITIDYYASTSAQSMIDAGELSGALLGSNILETSPYALSPFEAVQDQFWHRIFFQTTGETIQLNIYFTDEQMIDTNVVFSEFTLNAILFYARPDSSYF